MGILCSIDGARYDFFGGCGHFTSGSLGACGGGGGGGFCSLSVMVKPSPEGVGVEHILDQAKREVLRQTERHLEQQQALASASDQRAMAVCGALLVITALTIQGIDEDGPNAIKTLALLFQLLAVILSAYSAKPTRFFGSGGSGKGLKPWLNDEHCDKLIDAIISRNGDNIFYNERVIKRSSYVFQFSLAFAFIGICILLIEIVS